MSLEIKKRQVGQVTILDCVGKLTLADQACKKFRALIEKCVQEKGYKFALINLDEIEHVDSAGLSELIWAKRLFTKCSGKIKLLKVPEDIASLLAITELSEEFEDFSDEKRAIASFNPQSPTTTFPHLTKKWIKTSGQ